MTYCKHRREHGRAHNLNMNMDVNINVTLAKIQNVLLLLQTPYFRNVQLQRRPPIHNVLLLLLSPATCCFVLPVPRLKRGGAERLAAWHGMACNTFIYNYDV